MTQLLLREHVPAAILDHTPRQPTALRAAPAIGLELALVSDGTTFEALADDWRRLSAEAARPAQAFQAFDWCRQWCHHYLSPGEAGPRLAVVTARRAGRLVLVAPFVTQRSTGVRELVWLGDPVTQYGDILAAPEATDIDTLLEIWRFVIARTRADVANLRKVRADAIAAPLLARLGANVTAVEEAPFLDLSEDRTFEGWEERRQPRARKNRKRQARRLAETGEVALERHVGTETAGKLARLSVSLKRESLADKGAISPALADRRFEEFFAAAVGDPACTSGAVVRTLSVAGEPAALKVLIENDDVSMLHIAVFDPRFERCGAGAVLLEHVVRESIREGRKTLDLLAPRHDYKMDFADGIVAVNDYALAITRKGAIYKQAYLAVRRRLKALVEGLPAPVRRILARLAR